MPCQACRLHREAHVARLVDALCRLPCLRHTPIKELHRLACHLKEATYQPGELKTSVLMQAAPGMQQEQQALQALNYTELAGASCATASQRSCCTCNCALHCFARRGGMCSVW